ncbi:hypothetical protein ACHAQA_000912 [Verticillium albo-atrum]
MRSANVILALAAAVVASPTGNKDDKPVCNADNCLRALRNTARPGLAECSSFLKATVTPATSTIYTTTTFFTTPTNTFEVTGTITNLVTATEVIELTATETVTKGITIRPAKRQVTEVPSVLPTYATPCSGIARYTSACSCLGATAATVTAETPITVITVWETQTPTVIDEYVTVQTDTVTVTDATQTIRTTVATKTLTENVVVATEYPANSIVCHTASPQKLWGANKPATDDVLVAWCNSGGSGAFAVSQTKRGCFQPPFGTNKIEFTMRNAFGTAVSLSVAGCNQLMNSVVNGCNRGGVGSQQGWRFTAQVSGGQC